MKFLLRPMAYFLFFIFFACGDKNPNKLSGSIESTYSLKFKSVRIVQELDATITIRYETPILASSDSEYALKMNLDFGGVAPEANVDQDAAIISSLSRYRKATNATGQSVDDRATFPAVQRGNLRFFKYAQNIGDPANGSFEIVFVTGETLIGDFSAFLSAP